ncbi:hypothetical protein GCM10010168_11590 [Actinoplanes ianthinogenes]|uniref:Excreted virulence factor EspC (Type VII ESX diderm) n=1 Tax=Actinoplanes ianthinogenes TaxID=122358 RepID=A0ABN6CHD9_9ACTN|nr:hypothetical protein [Actinoplanes ianthinogenes]BCJ44346.1 hypothetical protein Aiant_50030 [Actinoplanes ianthinogenes]GGQ97423.1 hypothetical protein GCM10010168_11590 [Actinoplanes ianthinogenes]
MNPDLDVDATELRRAASAILATASRVRAAASAPPPVPGPRWASSGATSTAADAAEQGLLTVGADLTTAADQIETTLAAYGDADHRAATRLRAVR